MLFNRIKLINFRNHLDSEYEFGTGINVIYGNNGVGKTSILEAMSVCSMSKSFTACPDVSLINNHSKTFSVTGFCSNDLTIPHKISVSFTARQPKIIHSNESNNLLPKHIIGEIPMVALSPDNKKITSGSPEFRRYFLNSLLSQSNRIYLDKLYELRRILRQRNHLLGQIRNIYSDLDNQIAELLEQWSKLFIHVSAEIIIRRNRFVLDFNPFFLEAYQTLSNANEQVSLTYQSDSINEELVDKEQVINILTIRYNNLKMAEIKRGVTLFGPQKDDLLITINGGIAREYASQGQHKSLLIALKFAEFQYLLKQRNETPIILFDDIFSELDSLRVKKVIEMLQESKAQIFITLTEPTIIGNIGQMHNLMIEIKN